MKKKVSYKQHFIKDRDYDYLRTVLRFKVMEGITLDSISEQTGVHLWTLKNFYYQYSINSALPTKNFLALIEFCGFTFQIRFVPKT